MISIKNELSQSNYFNSEHYFFLKEYICKTFLFLENEKWVQFQYFKLSFMLTLLFFTHIVYQLTRFLL